MKFIELVTTDFQEFILNTDQIERIYKNKDGYCVIELSKLDIDGSAFRYTVMESYIQIKRMLGMCIKKDLEDFKKRNKSS